MTVGGSEVTDPDFFVSYTEKDQTWAEWIAWTLEAAGYRVVIQAWDFGAGSHFVEEMHRATEYAVRTVAVLSAAYLRSAYAAPEWQAAWAADPLGRARKLLVFRVEDCDRPGILRCIVSVDLFGVDQTIAQDRVLLAACAERAKPAIKPGFPGGRDTAGGSASRVSPVFPPELIRTLPRMPQPGRPVNRVTHSGKARNIFLRQTTTLALTAFWIVGYGVFAVISLGWIQNDESFSSGSYTYRVSGYAESSLFFVLFTLVLPEIVVRRIVGRLTDRILSFTLVLGFHICVLLLLPLIPRFEVLEFVR